MTAGEGVPPLATDVRTPAAGNGNGNGGATTTRPVPAETGAPEDASVDASRPRGSHLTYNPALDGIRGLAVGAVLLFHGGFTWARGGYLGVSTFFTLSGFLITSLLVVEFGRSQRVRLTAFWARRLRRLLPASAVTLAALLASMLVMNEQWERALPGDVIACALNVANWHFLFADRPYSALFTSPSPALHFWSLAIEEQFYWVFPLVTAVVLGLAKGSLRVYGAVLAGLLAVSAVLTLVFHGNQNTVYYSTPIRMGEILVGSLLAVALAEGRVAGLKRWAPLVGLLGALALAASAWAWWNVEEATPSLYKGGLLVYAVISGALVLSACVEGPVRRALSFEPLRLLGVISYGVYLFHWPIFLVIDEARIDRWLDPFNLQPRGAKLFAIRVAVTLAVAIASYRLLERPIRNGKRPKLVRPPLMAGGTVAAIVVAALVIPKIWEPPVDPFAAFTQPGGINGPDPSLLPPDAQIGVTLGDSTMLRTAWGLSAWGQENGNRLVLTGGSADLGCGIGRGGEVRYLGEQTPLKEQCQQWATTLPEVIGKSRDRYDRVDFAVVQTGPWDVADRKLEGEGQWRHIGDPVYDDYLRGELDAADDLLLDQGVTVVWLTAPYIEAGKNQEPPPSEPYPESDPARMDRLNDMIRELADQREGVVVVDLAAWVQNLPPGEDERLRPDGVHFDLERSVEVADWLAPQVMAAALSESPPDDPDDAAAG